MHLNKHPPTFSPFFTLPTPHIPTCPSSLNSLYLLQTRYSKLDVDNKNGSGRTFGGACVVGWVGACTCEWGGLGCGCVGGGMRFCVVQMHAHTHPRSHLHQPPLPPYTSFLPPPPIQPLLSPLLPPPSLPCCKFSPPHPPPHLIIAQLIVYAAREFYRSFFNSFNKGF